MSVKEGHVGYTQNSGVDETDSQPDIGACGGGTPKHGPSADPLTESMIDDGADNISMEVHLGEDSSRHPSEISSVSYQNLLEDAENSSQVYSRRDSEDSNDSYPPDEGDNYFPSEDIERFEASDLPISEKYKKPSEPKLASKVISDVEINIETVSDNSQVRKIQDPKETKDKSSSSSDKNNSQTSSSEQNIDSKETSNSVSLRKKNEHATGKDKSEPKEIIKKRNSLEIRNNIPTVGEVKSYEKDLEDLTYSAQGAKPKIRKQSPGLARRVCDSETSNEREGSSSERETELPEQKVMKEIPTDEPEELPGMEIECRRVENGVSQLLSQQRRPMDIENEYDYVKYARVQQGNSYVGMRLAYSSSNDSLNIKRNSQDTGSLESSRETSPEKILQQKILQDLDHKAFQGHVNEDSLIEIPLNGLDGGMGEDKKSFTLSPENTECDSVEIESVMSDGERGMPTVEDGLSSSQASDYEDANNIDSSTPAALIKQKQKNGVKSSNEVEKPKEIDAQAIMTDLKAKREALDSAIADIKTAIQQSKGVALQTSKYSSDPEEEPVWVMRDNNNEKKGDNVQKIQRQEEMRRVREEIERQQEQEYAQKEQQQVYEMEDEQEKLMNNQFTRNDGKVYQSPKVMRAMGYESDDEHEELEGKRYTRRIKGKKYAPLEKEDSLENGAYSNNMDSSHNSTSKITNTNSHSTSSQKLRHDSESHCSSEEYCSDREPLSRTTYVTGMPTGESDTDEETDRLLHKQYQRRDQYVEIPELTEPSSNRKAQAELRRSRAKEAQIRNPDNPEVLIEGVLFRARYLGSTQLISEGQPSKALRMMQAQEAVGRIKAPEGENQPSTDVDLFVSTEKLMVLNTDLQEIMMDHSLRTISYIADIGDVLVLMARRRLITSPGEGPNRRRQAKILCHVFESEEAQLIAQSIGQAFQVAYMEFLKANGIEDPGLLKEMDYQDVLNQQEIYGEELNLFANKDHHKEVIVPKAKNELLGVVIVESGWGSMVPTVVLANMSPIGPAARCGQLNIGDQIISINGISLVGLPLSACQTYIKAAKNQTVVKLTVVPCPPVVEVIIKRPDVKYQLGFSVQNGVICSLLRGGIAERGGVRVGHRIIEINNQSVVAVPHEKIVSLLANSVGEIHMKTMPTSIFRLLTGQDTPHYL
ncbi:golgin subfamily A member 6-like protein 22 isoform X2 [Patella vulgata]|uniref:golgin subfamily A member 6-like protein 22 isoform X2 n=1 Tax=Patella vulgata TaxID=6465 RepID=UPI0021808B64|nr:golgin subfamily A member 6-like protein 22 isoform X2 [Patella vulgata]